MDVVALGELLMDFTSAGEARKYTANPGGAPANVLVQLSRLGHQTAFMGMVGEDFFGRDLCDTLQKERVDTQGLKMRAGANTTLAFVHIDDHGDRSFTFFRNPGADTLFSAADIDCALLDSTKIFHFGGVSLSKDPARTATITAAQYAGEHGALVSFDPNYRPLLWDSEEEAVAWMKKGVGLCRVLKISQEEAQLLTGNADLAQAAELLSQMGPELVLITLGPAGCYCSHPALKEHFPTYDTPVVDTTGSGDSFFGATLHKLLEYGVPVSALEAQQLTELVQYANAAGSTCAAAFGAIPALPDHQAIISCTVNTRLLQYDIK